MLSENSVFNKDSPVFSDIFVFIYRTTGCHNQKDQHNLHFGGSKFNHWPGWELS